MRDGATRAREVEEAAQGLVAWCDEFVVDVSDRRGHNINTDWQELIESLRSALRPLEDK